MISLEDIAAIVAIVFARPDEFIGQAFDIAADELTYPEATRALSAGIGEPVRYVQISWQAMRDQSEDIYLDVRLVRAHGLRRRHRQVRELHPGCSTSTPGSSAATHGRCRAPRSIAEGAARPRRRSAATRRCCAG